MVKLAWKKYQIVTVAFTALFVLGNGGLSFWIYQSYQKVQEEEASLQTQITTAKVKGDKVPSLEKEVIILRENVNEFVKILPDTKEVNGFVKKLSDFNEQSGVELYVLKDDRVRTNRQKKKDVFDRETFRVELRGNIFQVLKFISLVENYERFIKISEIHVKAGSYAEDILRSDVVHQVSILVETFVYHGNEGVAGGTKIQNYDRKRELLQDEIDSARNRIKIDRYEYVCNPALRDPFIDPRTWVTGAEQPEGLDLKEQEKFITNMMDKILEIKELLEYAKSSSQKIPLIRRLEIRKEIASRIINLNGEINSSIEERWITDPGCKKKFDYEIMPEITRLNRDNKDLSDGPMVISEKELVSIRDTIIALYDKEDYEGCEKRYHLMKSQLGERLAEVAKDEPKRKLLNEIELICHQAMNAQEFKKIELKISGVICQSERSIVIVNGMVLSEGQFLQDDLKIEKISTKAVFFNYKGQTFKIQP